MKLIAILICSLLALSALGYAGAEPQVFPTSAGPVKITPLNHASTLIEAEENHLPRSRQAREIRGTAKSRPHSNYRHSRGPHGPGFDQGGQQGGNRNSGAAGRGPKPSPAPSPLRMEKPRPGRAGLLKLSPLTTKTWSLRGKTLPRQGTGQRLRPRLRWQAILLLRRYRGCPEMRALKNIDVAFVCMNLPYTMSPDEAAHAVKAFHPEGCHPLSLSRIRSHRISKGTGRHRHRGALASSGIRSNLVSK